MKANKLKIKIDKEFFVGAIVFFAFFFFWLFLRHIFQVLPESSLFVRFSDLVFYFIFLSFLGILLVVVEVLVERVKVLLLTFFFSCLCFFIFFSFKILYFFGVLLLFFALIWGYFRIKEEKKNRIKFEVQKIAQYSLPLFLGVMIFLTAFVYYFFVATAITNQNNFQIPKEFFDKATHPLEKILPSLIPGFKKDSTIEDIVYLFFVSKMEKAVDSQAKEGDYKNFIPPTFFALFKDKIPEDKDEFFKKLREDKKIKKEAMKLFLQELPQVIVDGEDVMKILKDLNLSGKESVSEALNIVVNNEMKKVIAPYLKYFPIIFALIFAVGARFIFSFLIWLIYFFVWLIIKILIAINFVKIKKETKEVEIISL